MHTQFFLNRQTDRQTHRQTDRWDRRLHSVDRERRVNNNVDHTSMLCSDNGNRNAACKPWAGNNMPNCKQLLKEIENDNVLSWCDIEFNYPTVGTLCIHYNAFQVTPFPTTGPTPQARSRSVTSSASDQTPVCGTRLSPHPLYQ